MGMEAVVQRDLGISPEETATVVESVCEPANSSVAPLGILVNDQRSRIVTKLPHHKGVYTQLV
jgi:hypothetical protein